MQSCTPNNKVKKIELYLAILTLFTFLMFVVTPFVCKTYLNEKFDTVVGSVLGISTPKTKDNIPEKVNTLILKVLN